MEWINIKKEFPKHQKAVLVLPEDKYMLPFIGCFITGRGFVNLATQNSHSVTHWIPLPERPEGE